MSQLSQFAALAQSGQELSRESLWPCTVLIAGQCYDASQSGLSSEMELHNGDFIAVRKMTFTVLAALFTAAGQPLPTPDAPLRWVDGKMDLLIKTVEPDPTRTIVTLRCEAPPQ